MRFVHIADIHLGMSFSTGSFGAEKGDERRRDIKETLFRVLDFCEEKKVDLLLVAGDLFEEELVSLSDLKDLNDRFGQLTSTEIVIGAGNHDPIIDSRSPYTLVDWVDHVHILTVAMEKIELSACNTVVWGFSWKKKELPPFETPALQVQEGSFNVLMLHGDVYQKNEYLYIDKNEVLGLGMDYVALGHIHRPDFFGSTMAYPGSLEPLDFSEGGAHGFVYGAFDGEGCRIEFKPFAKRSFKVIEIVVDGRMSFEAICQKAEKALKEELAEDYYRLILKGDRDPEVTMDLKGMKHRLAPLCAYVEIRDRTELDLDLEQLRKDYEGSLIGAYIDALTEKGLKDPVVHDAMKKGLKILLEEQVNQ